MAAIANDGSAVIQREVAAGARRAETAAEAAAVYEIERTAEVVAGGGYGKVALQFPDELLADSTLVAGELQRRVGAARVFILADTSYGSCCVDEVAAEHYGADLVVHYGRTCLSLTSRVPVFYVFGRMGLDVNDCADKAQRALAGRNVLLVCDVPYAHALPDLAAAMRACAEPAFGHVVASTIGVLDRPYVPGDQQAAAIRPGRTWELAAGTAIGDYAILYVGEESLTLTNVMVTERSAAVFSYSAETGVLREESHMVNRHLGRRYAMVHKARDADVVGVLVGTLAAARYLRVVEALKEMLRRRGKKYYVFVVGKLNVAKLANFPEIQAFVLVACPENTLVDSRDYYQPIVTPYEMLLALSRSRDWTGDYVTDFHALLDEIAALSDDDNGDDGEGSDADAPHFSLVTGALKQSRKYHQAPSGAGGDETALVAAGVSDLSVRDRNTEIARYMGSAGAEFLLARSFRGLGHDGDQSAQEPMLAVDGLSGIARGYSHERERAAGKE
ncbi:Diphthamide biosynthesis protein 2 [Coemansia javaensis]|uniref:2-(3-amino-3-carboxypropyl)histidine synthase subunit 2 n=1 Tax=Coemansia javaensis TaxID=2761396 RepID=A0A9W8HIT1_9FUNG|nr:Diphthamide biosynthesis protein 2 [Coemansia javaensis]